MNLKIKKEFQVLIPPLSELEYKQLEINCMADGIRDRILVWKGFIVDGHNRYNIAQKNRLKFQTEEIALETESHVKKFIIELQLGRRNLPEFVKIELSHELKKVLLEIGKENKGNNQYTPKERMLSTNDKKHNTQKQLAERLDVSTGKLAQAEVVIKKAPEEVKKKLRAGDITINRAYKDIKKEERKTEERQKLIELGKSKDLNIDFRLGDFEKVFKDIKDNSIDCIITDPPYPLEFIECWAKLSRFAKRVLKKNSYCIAYSGQMNLPEVIKRMNENLDYYWTFALYHQGATQIVNGVNIMCRWKPVLIYQNGKKKLDNTIQDYFISEQREKSGHNWQQSESGVKYLIEKFTNAGDILLDPFAGSGTTLKVGRLLKRNVLGAEINQETFNIAKGNLYE